MKRISFLLLTLLCLYAVTGVSAKSTRCLGVPKSTVNYTSPLKKDTCKLADKIKSCCKTKKQVFKVKDQHFYSGALDLIVKLFPVLTRFTDDQEPLDAGMLTQKQFRINQS